MSHRTGFTTGHIILAAQNRRRRSHRPRNPAKDYFFLNVFCKSLDFLKALDFDPGRVPFSAANRVIAIEGLEMESGVRRWLVNVSLWNPSVDQFASVVSLLPEDEQRAVAKYVKFDDRKRALVSRLLQYSLVHEVLGIPYDKIIIHRTLEGKPYLINSIGSPFPNFNFNVSHHGDYVGITYDPLCLVGLDIVSIMIPERTTEHEFMSNFSAYLTALEWKNIAKTGASEEKLCEFYRYWCLKEAFVKAIGAGLGFGFHRLEFHHRNWTDISVYIDGIESNEWKFSLFKIDERHWASIARGLATGADEQFDASLPIAEIGFTQRTVDQLIQSLSHGAQQNSC